MNGARSRWPRALLLAALLGTPVTGGSAAAPEAVDALILYRQHTMKALAGHTGALRSIARDKVPFAAHASEHARAALALIELIPELYPPGSRSRESRARGAIWTEPDAFAEHTRDARDLAREIVRQLDAGTREGFSAAVERFGDACRHCHRRFRARR